jgi:hypothetical protein
VIRTIAYTVDQCHQDAQGIDLFEKLVVRRGNCDPVTVMELPPVENAPNPVVGGCDLYGDFRIGKGSLPITRFQRLGMLPDGSGVVVEITNDYAFPLGLTPEPPEEGLFFIRPDGTKKDLGPPVGLPIFALQQSGLSPVTQVQAPNFTTNPRLRQLAFVGRGPGPSGEDASQVFVLDVDTKVRRQVTQLPAAPDPLVDTCCPFFFDERTILFRNGFDGGLWEVRTDGRHLRKVQTSPTIGGTIVASFNVSGGRGSAFALHIPKEPVRRYSDLDKEIIEVLLVDGKRQLQLTKFGYPDTGTDATVDFGRAVFTASADPLGENPAGMCQFFSVNILGAGLRQLTHFPDDHRDKLGCLNVGPLTSCRVNALAEDPRTGAIPFVSSCDPVGRNPDGEQLFTMRRDGSGLRQITAFRGVERFPDGALQVEMAGSAAFSAVIR